MHGNRISFEINLMRLHEDFESIVQLQEITEKSKVTQLKLFRL
jgi:hypothetical protein